MSCHPGTPHLRLSPFALALLVATGCATQPSPSVAPPGPSGPPAESAEPRPDEPSARTTAPAPEAAAVPEPTPIRVAPTRPPPPLAPPEFAAAETIAVLARQLRIEPGAITVAGVSRASWPDACLGLAAEGEICASMITAGFSVSLEARGLRYEFRTDEPAQRIRLAAAPPATLGDSQLVWRDARSFAMMAIGSEGMAIGRRGRALLPVPGLDRMRGGELQGFLATYAPLQARTPAGEVILFGRGARQANATEQRMLAEWALEVRREADDGTQAARPVPALTWRRLGGIAGFCDTIVVSRAGAVSVFDCRDGNGHPRAVTRLEPAELELLYRWLDGFESFTWREDDPGASATADPMTTSLKFEGEGVDEAPPGERDRMLALIEAIARRLAGPQA